MILNVTGSAGVDCLPDVNAKLALLKALGGGTLRFPQVGGAGWSISDRILVDFSYCTVELDDNLTWAKTQLATSTGVTDPITHAPNKPNQRDGVIHFLGAAGAYLQGCRLVGLRRGVTIDANGRNINQNFNTGYVHNAYAGGDYSAVLFAYCNNPICENVYVYNPISFGISMQFSIGGIIDKCAASDTVFENGIQVSGSLFPISAVTLDPTTWANCTIRDCQAWLCCNHGIGSYGTVGVNIVNPKVWNCGNDGASPLGRANIAQAGPAGGINVEHDGTNTSFDYHVTIVNPQVYNSYGYGIRINCKGTRILGGYVSGTKKPTNAIYVSGGIGYFQGQSTYGYTFSAEPAPNPVWGSSLFVQGLATCDTVGLVIEGSDRYGIRMNAGTANQFPSLNFQGGSVSGCALKAGFFYGTNEVTISRETKFTANGTSGTISPVLDFANNTSPSASNYDLGTLRIGGHFAGNYGFPINTSHNGTIIIDGITGGENYVGLSAPPGGGSIGIGDCAVALTMRNICLTNANALQSRVAFLTGTIANAWIDWDSITGGQQQGAVFKVDFSNAISVNQRGAVMYGKSNWTPGAVPASSANGPGTMSTSVTLKGAKVGDKAHAFITSLLSGLMIQAEVTTADTVTATLYNFTNTAITLSPASPTLFVRVERAVGN